MHEHGREQRLQLGLGVRELQLLSPIAELTTIPAAVPECVKRHRPSRVSAPRSDLLGCVQQVEQEEDLYRGYI